MLSKEARKLIFENKAAFAARKNAPPQEPPSVEQTRRAEWEANAAMTHVYPNTSVTTEDFNGTPVDVMIPKVKKGENVYFYIHGGAWAFGSAMHARLTACYYTEECGCVALCPDYRLAPEHKFSVLLEDCYRAYLFACKRYGAKNIVLSGSSAGGNLALALMQVLRERKGEYPKGMILLSPVTEIRPEKKDSCMKPYDIVLRDYDESVVASYGDRAEDYRKKYFSPLYGEYDGFPPMYICCGSEELLLDDSVKLFQRAKAAGVKAVLSVRAGMWHSYPECQHFIPEGKEELKNAVSFVADIDGDITV